ncbi:MAG: GAF domain-containing protein [bacterium]|nr:GAF domain-containing protein [bacterium]
MTKRDRYIVSLREMKIRLEKGGDLFADLGNVAAVLRKQQGFYWVGFYLLKDERLVLGPFQGTPACVFLTCGEGVCGSCVERRAPIIVDDVRDFPGHVACDPRSRSEIVIPCFDDTGDLRAILDIDSDQPHHFDEIDLEFLQRIEEQIRPLWGKIT